LLFSTRSNAILNFKKRFLNSWKLLAWFLHFILSILLIINFINIKWLEKYCIIWLKKRVQSTATEDVCPEEASGLPGFSTAVHGFGAG
jgi:hypothetical protein